MGLCDILGKMAYRFQEVLRNGNYETQDITMVIRDTDFLVRLLTDSHSLPVKRYMLQSNMILNSKVCYMEK